ncbi:tail fiber protein [Escherichia phage vB_EcoM_SA91KD]|uniref:tail fiber protein n=1 Tax=Escherichia phage vB_EcoM_SA91KD TaxID=2909742 RepID=UPI0024AE4E35|nr:tail fiber protein [Escherichia phage vB_EcoM_SA91KD]UIU26884.1 tail fiber protein [Escherichia phage vB_EcoM_SA91KD]
MAKGYSLDALVKEKWSRYTTSVTTGTDFDNLNTVELSGIYYIPSISLANSLLNIPVKVAGIVEVLPWSNSTGCVIQRFTTYSDGTEWKRSYDGVKWSPWSQTLTSLNVFSVMYPIGIVVQFDNATNPNNSFIGTVWEQIVDGRSARAATGPEAGTADGQIGSVAGSDTTTIAVTNMPGHTHGMQNHTHGIASHTHTMAHTHTINHDHGAVTSSSAGAHTHTVSGTAASNGNHTHTVPSVNGGNSGGSIPLRSGRNDVESNSTNTGTAGAHTHSVSGTAASSGAHTHSVDLPNFTGTSGGSSAGNTGGTALTTGGPSNNETTSTGGGTALNVRNSSHYYAFWKRVA